MDHAGVEKAFLISYDGWDMPYYMEFKSAGRESFWGGADYCRHWAERYPERLLGSSRCAIRARSPGCSPLERRLDQGAHGIKVFPGFLETNIDDPALMEAYALVRERGRRIIFGFEDTNRPTTPTIHEVWEAFARVAEAFPDLPMQTNHMGYLDPRAGRGASACSRSSARTRTSTSPARACSSCGRTSTSTRSRATSSASALLRDGCGADRIVYGTDWPWLEHYFMYPQLVESIRRHADFLTEEEKELFLHRNARRFLGRGVMDALDHLERFFAAWMRHDGDEMAALLRRRRGHGGPDARGAAPGPGRDRALLRRDVRRARGSASTSCSTGRQRDERVWFEWTFGSGGRTQPRERVPRRFDPDPPRRARHARRRLLGARA